jgi:ubiquinone/menaquinone biosynthesis C-methylase UbiE
MTESVPRKTPPGAVLHGAAHYDFVVWLLTLGRERRLRDTMIRLARLGAGESVLDVGCGTGTLAILAKGAVGPTGEVYGIDPSPEMIARAQKKARKAGAEIALQTGTAQELPFADARFDVALSTLMLHHLARAARVQCLREIKRVLRPQGRVLVVDFESSSKPHGILRHFHRRHGHVAEDDVHQLLEEAGMKIIDSGPVGFRDLHFSLASSA